MKFLLLFVVTFFAHIVVSQQDTTDQRLYNKIISLDETIRNNLSKQISYFNPNDTTSLPIGIVKEIGNTKYIICIDSAWFTPDGAFFNVYMALMPPNAEQPIAFAAKGIQFNPKGVSVAGGARLELVTQQAVKIGPKLEVVFKKDGQNFVEFDCNGYKRTGLSLDFIFDSESFVNANDPSEPVKASMQMAVTDLSDITYNLQSITPFRLKAANDFVFKMSNIVVDLSDASTPAAVPTQYINTATLPNGMPSWTGFYAQNITVELPQKLKSPSNPGTSIYAQNMIIDDTGLSGHFGATNVLTDGDMSSAWGFTIDEISVDIAHNSLIGGNMDGMITIPQLDDTDLDYNASMYQNQGDEKLAFNFTVSPASDIQLSSFKSELNISASSQINIASVGDQFRPSAVLTGDWTVDFPRAKFNGISFQNLQIGPTAPYINSGTFALTSNGSSGQGLSLFGLNVSMNNVGLTLTPQGKLAFTTGLAMNLGSGSNTFAAATNVRIITNLAAGVDGRDRFNYDRLAVDDIAISAQTTAFGLTGVISVRNDDPVFGDMFFGSVSLNLRCLDGPILVSAGFGKLNGDKYWFTEAAVPTDIPIGTGLSISSIYGGVQKGVLTTLTNQELLGRAAGTITTSSTSAIIPFVPDATQGLTFRAGVGLEGEREEAFNGEALLEVAFNANGGFQSIQFLGQAYMMVSRQKRNSGGNKIFGDISVLYDHSNKVFDAGVNAQISFPGTVTGGLNIALHIDQNDWYFWLNNPVNRANLNLVNLFDVNAYFMVGTQIMAIPPPPSYVTNLVGGGSIGALDPTALGNGGGFATGMEIGVNFGGEFPKTTKWRGFLQVNIGGGFDIMLLNVQNAHCAGSSDPVGVNGYYAMGQVYVYMGGSFGARKYKDNGNGDLKKEYSLGSLQVAALLQGKLPKPSFVYGAVGIQANIFNVINFTFNADVEFGTNCTLVGT